MSGTWCKFEKKSNVGYRLGKPNSGFKLLGLKVYWPKGQSDKTIKTFLKFILLHSKDKVLREWTTHLSNCFGQQRFNWGHVNTKRDIGKDISIYYHWLSTWWEMLTRLMQCVIYRLWKMLLVEKNNYSKFTITYIA